MTCCDDLCTNVVTVSEANPYVSIIGPLTAQAALHISIRKVVDHPAARFFTRPGVQFRSIDPLKPYWSSTDDNCIGIADFDP